MDRVAFNFPNSAALGLPFLGRHLWGWKGDQEESSSSLPWASFLFPDQLGLHHRLLMT